MELLLVFVRFLGSSSTIPNAHIAIVMIFVYLNGMIYRPQSADYLVQPGHKSHNKPSTQNGQKTTCALCQALLNRFYCLFAGCSAVFEASRNVQIHSRAVVITIINFNVDFKRKKWMELNFHTKCKNNWLWTVSAQRRTVNSTHTEWMNECVSVTKNRNQQKTLRNYVNWWKACDINRSWLTENGIVKFSNQFDGFDERSLAKFG